MNSLKRVLSGALFLAVSASALAGCGGAKPSTPASGAEGAAKGADTIKVAMVAPMTGDDAQFGQSAKQGIELALEQINAKGVLGKKLELVTGDDKGDPKEAASVAQQLLARKDITAILGHFFSGTTLAAGPIYQRASMPTLAIASTNPKVASIGDFVYRINVGDNYQGKQLADWLVTKQGKKKIAVIYDNNDYGKGVSDVFIKRAKEINAQIVASETFVSGQDKDFGTQLTKIKSANPDVLVMCVLPAEGAMIVQQAKRLGLNVPVAASDSIYSDDFTRLGGKDVEGVYTVSYFHHTDPHPKAQEFVKAYKAKYNKLPDSWAPYAYDAALVMAQAIEKAGSTDGKKIRDALAQTNYEGATGLTQFKNGREPDGKDLVILQVKDGAFNTAQ